GGGRERHRPHRGRRAPRFVPRGRQERVISTQRPIHPAAPNGGERPPGKWAELKTALRNRRARRDLVAGLAFLAPSLLVLVLFVYFPIVWAFGISFTNWQAGVSATNFV